MHKESPLQLLISTAPAFSNAGSGGKGYHHRKGLQIRMNRNWDWYWNSNGCCFKSTEFVWHWLGFCNVGRGISHTIKFFSYDIALSKVTIKSYVKYMYFCISVMIFNFPSRDRVSKWLNSHILSSALLLLWKRMDCYRYIYLSGKILLSSYRIFLRRLILEVLGLSALLIDQKLAYVFVIPHIILSFIVCLRALRVNLLYKQTISGYDILFLPTLALRACFTNRY